MMHAPNSYLAVYTQYLLINNCDLLINKMRTGHWAEVYTAISVASAQATPNKLPNARRTAVSFFYLGEVRERKYY